MPGLTRASINLWKTQSKAMVPGNDADFYKCLELSF
jgi:hypothetical protein